MEKMSNNGLRMKRPSQRIFIWILFLIFLSSSVVCSGGAGPNTPTDIPIPIEGLGSGVIANAAKAVGPTVSTAASVSVAADASTAKAITGTIMSTIYSMIRDYEYPRDEGVIDMHNIYKVLMTAEQIYLAGQGDCTVIPEESIPPPFDVGFSDTYDCAGNSGTMSDEYAGGIAIREGSDGTFHLLLTFLWVSSEYGVLQGTYNPNAGDLDMSLAELVDHDDGRFYVRSRITGNEGTHAFELSMITGPITNTSEFVSVVGRGVSKGTGNYFLFKVKSGSVAGNYFCIPADPTETVLESLSAEDPEGASAPAEECAGYQVDVDAMTFLTTDDVPLALSDFTDSSILIDY